MKRVGARGARRLRLDLAVVLIVLAGLNLRIAVTSVPPVVDDLQRELDLSATAAGLLTSAPVVCFGLLAPLAPALGRRLGGEGVVLLAMAAIAAGLLVRGLPLGAALFAGTIVAGAGIAVANVIVPALVKERRTGTAGWLTGSYAAALGVGAALGAGLTVPLADAIGTGGALAVWAVPAALAAAAAALAARRRHAAVAVRVGAGDGRALLRDAVAWQVTAFMALQSLVFYAAVAWLPSILRDSGYEAGEAGAALSLFAIGGVPASLAAPVLAARLRDQRAVAAAVAALEAAAIAGLLVAPGAAIAWVAVFAVGQGGGIGLALTLFVLRAPDARRAGELSAMAQTIGYAVAAAGPATIGAIHDATGSWDEPLLALLALVGALLVAGLASGRPLLVRASPAAGPAS